MSHTDIQILKIQIDQQPYEPHKIRPDQAVYPPDGQSRAQYISEHDRKEREKARHITFYASTIQLKNIGTEFHTVALITYRTEGGVIDDHRHVDFGPIPPQGIVQKEFGMGSDRKSQNWHIGGITVDGRTYPMNRPLTPTGAFGGGGRRGWFSAPSM
jgi:hypothetical protein